MSAIARYFLHQGITVGGYDRTPSPLTEKLCEEGAMVHYEESVDMIPAVCKKSTECLVIYTPAIPAEHKELVFFRQHGFEIQKRAQVLGTLTRQHKGLCVAGTHGKTTTSTMCAHIMHQSHLDCNAFLGGISKMYKEICLLQMPFVKDDKVSVEQYVAAAAKELGSPVTVKGYIRYEKGEGIEKRQDDLAAEVAKMVNG